MALSLACFMLDSFTWGIHKHLKLKRSKTHFYFFLTLSIPKLSLVECPLLLWMELSDVGFDQQSLVSAVHLWFRYFIHSHVQTVNKSITTPVLPLTSNPGPPVCLLFVIIKVPYGYPSVHSWPRLSVRSRHCNWIFLKCKSHLFTLLINNIWFHTVLRMNFQFLSQDHIALYIWFLQHSPGSLEMNECPPSTHTDSLLSQENTLFLQGHWAGCSSSCLNPTLILLNSLTLTYFKNQCWKYFLQTAFVNIKGQNKHPPQEPSQQLSLSSSLCLWDCFAGIYLLVTFPLITMVKSNLS